MEKSIREKIEIYSSPIALIIGGDHLSAPLSEKLKQSSCDVIEVNEPPKSGKFNYIFQFGQIDEANEVYDKHLRSGGKFLFIDTDDDNLKSLQEHGGISIVRIGETQLWNGFELADILLEALFTDKASVLDIRKIKKIKPVREVKPESDGKNSEEFEKEKAYLEKKYIRKNLSRNITIPLFILFFILGTALLLGGWYISSFNQSLNDFQRHLGSSDFPKAQEDVRELRNKLKIGKTVMAVSSSNLFPLNSISYVRELNGLIEATDQLLTVSENSLTFINEFSEADRGFFNQNFSLSSDFGKLSDTLDSLSTASKNLMEKSESTALPFFPKDNLLMLLNNAQKQIDAVRLTLPIFRKILLTENPVTYLLLFQNNMELRPTGGFIGSVGFLTFNEGKMVEFKIMDVYSIDGQLKGHVEPPLPIRNYLSQPNWFLRDSNFDPDFALASQQAEFFIDKTLGTKIDGVIAVNLNLLNDLLEAVGPVTLTDFNNEVISKDNLFIKSQLYIQNNFFEGSTLKKDFLTSLSFALEKRFQENVPWFKVFQVVKNSLDNKSILIYVKSPDLQKEIEDLGWAGRVFSVNCLLRPETCLADYLHINEANLGVNKANYFVSKNTVIDKKINLNGQVITDITITYENQSLPRVLQGGTYSNYLRIFVPEGSTLLSVSFNEAELDKATIDSVPYPPDKISFGLLLKLPENSRNIFRLSYLLPNIIKEETSSYQFFLQKQGGEKLGQQSVTFASSKYRLKPLNFNSLKDNPLTLSVDNSVDRIITLEVSP